MENKSLFRPLECWVMWRCSRGKHRFKSYRRITEDKRHSDRINYYMRTCICCGYTEIQSAGPMGSGKWRDAATPFRHKWEQEDFNRSIIEAT